MKALALSSTLLFSFTCFSEQFECSQHPDWPNERTFTATIEVSKESVTVSNLQLSEVWPLPEHCDSPVTGGKTNYKRNTHIEGISFGPYSENECGYVFSLNFDEKDLALLHVVRSIKVWGEKPYLANKALPYKPIKCGTARAWLSSASLHKFSPLLRHYLTAEHCTTLPINSDERKVLNSKWH